MTKESPHRFNDFSMRVYEIYKESWQSWLLQSTEINLRIDAWPLAVTQNENILQNTQRTPKLSMSSSVWLLIRTNGTKRNQIIISVQPRIFLLQHPPASWHVHNVYTCFSHMYSVSALKRRAIMALLESNFEKCGTKMELHSELSFGQLNDSPRKAIWLFFSVVCNDTRDSDTAKHYDITH